MPRSVWDIATTSRWLRGRIVDRLRATRGDGWIAIQGPLGAHDRVAVAVEGEPLAHTEHVVGLAKTLSPAVLTTLPR